MANVELVVKIPKEYYEVIKSIPDNQCTTDMLIIKNGTPLPKGHGDLIDITNIDVVELEDSNHIIRHVKGDEVDVYISAPIIIKADKAESEDKK